jgi:hypothetical protein
MSKKQTKQRFVLNLKLITEKWHEDMLNVRFEIGRQLYNAILGKALNRYKEMIKTKKYRNNPELFTKVNSMNIFVKKLIEFTFVYFWGVKILF